MSHKIGSLPEGRLMGLDYGTVRIGVALSDPGRLIASPHSTLGAGQGLLASLFKLVEEEQVILAILGLPLRGDGSPGTLDQEIRRFALMLEERGLAVQFQDEAFSSRRAQGILRTAGRKRDRGGKAKATDRLAAALLLQDYLDAHPELRA